MRHLNISQKAPSQSLKLENAGSLLEKLIEPKKTTEMKEETL